MTYREIEVWNEAILTCCDAIYSDGVQLHPELVEKLLLLRK